MAPAMTPGTAAEGGGQPIFKDGAFEMVEVEELEETYCPKHSNVLIERQEEAKKLLAAGDAEGAQQALMGATPFPMLGDGSEDPDA
jgi:hypothetical protein